MRMFNPDRSRAVLIGTSRYEADAGLAALPAVRNNVDALDVTLTEAALCGLPPERCVVVSDPQNAAAVGQALEEAGEGAEDLLLIYYAGHGLIDRRGELYLGLRGTDSRPGMLPYSGVPYNLVRESVRMSRAASRVVILDCCFSGRAIDAATGPDAVVAGQVEIQGAYTLTSSSRTSVSIAKESEEFTAFTGELLRVLRRGVPGGPDLLNVDLIYDELRTGLSRAGMPEPQISRMQSIHHLGIARNAALGTAVPLPAAASPEPAKEPKKPKPPPKPPVREERFRGRSVPVAGLVLIPALVMALVAALLAAPRVIQLPGGSPDKKEKQQVAPAAQPTQSTLTGPGGSLPPGRSTPPAAAPQPGDPAPAGNGDPQPQRRPDGAPKAGGPPSADPEPTQGGDPGVQSPPPPATLSVPMLCGMTRLRVREWAQKNGVVLNEEAADSTKEVVLSQSRRPGSTMQRGESITVRLGSSIYADCRS